MTRHHPIQTSQITVLILAGGRGSRMGGRDKGLIPIAGKPAIEHVLDRLQHQSQQILISANRNLGRYAAYGYPVIEDTLKDFPGPLAGVLAGLSACKTDYLLTLPVDTPLVSADYLSRMRAGLQTARGLACVAEFHGQMEPVFCLLNRQLHPALQRYLDQGRRSVRDWLDQVSASRIEFSDAPEQFINLNVEQERQRAELLLERQRSY